MEYVFNVGKVSELSDDDEARNKSWSPHGATFHLLVFAWAELRELVDGMMVSGMVMCLVCDVMPGASNCVIVVLSFFFTSNTM